MFNRQLLEMRSNGDLERLRRYWMTGACRPGKQEHKSSDPLALEQVRFGRFLFNAINAQILFVCTFFLNSIYPLLVLVCIFTSDGWHFVGCITVTVGASLFQVFP